mmetsp:Transcript_50702/g.121097  ORF Transcript_50702/g.121097 Transcript_50702/m.121097 type:complete len:268 (+) Transcript_50702:104-907(+)
MHHFCPEATTLDVDVCRLPKGFGVDPLHHRLELLHRSALEELLEAILDHGRNGGLPKNAVHELVRQKREKLSWRGSGADLLASDVHVHITSRRIHFRLGILQGCKELFPGRLHQLRVKTTRGLQHLRLQAAFCSLDFLLETLDRSKCARAREAVGKQEVCHLAHITRLCHGLAAELVENLLPEPCNGEHRLLRSLSGLLHGLTTKLHDLQPCLEVEYAGCSESCVLSKREPSNRLATINLLRLCGLQLLPASEPGYIHGRLAELRAL